MKTIIPDWQVPTNVHAFMTTRHGGVSQGVYGDLNGVAGLNPATHVGDDVADVLHNRSLIAQHLPNEPLWLNQTHSTKVWLESKHTAGDYQRLNNPPEADAVVVTEKGAVGVIMTADCLPVLFTAHDGSVVGAAHAGWRGLLNGVLENTIDVMVQHGAVASKMHAWLGAAIGPDQFEVGQEVLDAFVAHDVHSVEQVKACFKPVGNGKYLADIYTLARLRLQARGLTQITGGNHCTVTEAEDFYSYRRDHTTGRMASMIWIAE